MVVDGCGLEMNLGIDLFSRCLYFFSKTIFICNDLILEFFVRSSKNLSSKNPGILAAQILATSDKELQNKIIAYKDGLAEKVEASRKEINS